MKLKAYLLLVAFMLLPFFAFADETLTITTYYPSPYGSYNQLTVASNTYLAYSSGSVGIGTTAPSAKLQVLLNGGNGAAGLSDYGIATTASSGQATLGAEFTGDGYANLDLGQNQSGTRRFWHISSRTSGAGTPYSLEIYNYNVSSFNGPLFTIAPGGYIGIGNANPDYKLDVGIKSGSPQSATAGAGGLIRNASPADSSPYTQARIMVYGGTNIDTTNYAYLGYGSDAIMRIVYGNSSQNYALQIGRASGYDGSGAFSPEMTVKGGNVGIGTVGPAAKLSFADLNDGRNTADGITWYNPSPTQYGIYRSSGAWSAPNYQQLMLSWATGIVIDGGTLYGKSFTLLQPNGGNVGIGATPTAGLEVNSASADVASFHNTGGTGLKLTGGNTTWTVISDDRLKVILGNIKDATKKLLAMRPVYFRLKVDKKNAPRRVGLVAQDVQKVFPEVVDVDSKGYLGLRYTELTPLLIAAVQEQEKIIEEQVQSNASMRKELDEIKARLKNRGL